MTKVLVITPFFYPHVGGSQQYMEGLYLILRQKHPDINVDVLCYNTDNVKNKENYKGLTIYRLPCLNILPGKFALPNPFALLAFVNKHKQYTLINTSTRFFDCSWWAPIFAKLIGTKIVLTDHCAATPKHSNPFISFLVWIVDTITGNLFLPLYDKIFVVSRATRLFLKRKFNVSSQVLYGGVDTKLYHRKRNNNRIQVLYAGRMIQQKGVYELLEVAKHIPRADFIFAGPGEMIFDQMPNIKIVGKLDKRNLIKLLSSSDIFVLPSLHSEGIPMALLEAGAAKLATVATDVGGIKEVIKNGKTGLLVKPKDKQALKKALEKLISTPALRRKLGNALYSHIEAHFNWDKTAKIFHKYTLRLVP